MPTPPVIQFKRLPEIDPGDIIDLMNNPHVRRLMPLSRDGFDRDACAQFVAGKEKLWQEHGYGPWAFVIDGRFAGWGGLQPEAGDADLAIVLHPRYWGMGKTLFDRILAHAFGPMNLASVTVLLPPARTRTRALQRLGFIPDGQTDIAGQPFLCFRLHNPTHETSRRR